jgi:DNA replication protein DnaC
VIPAKYRGVSFDRSPVTEIESMVVRVVRSFTEDLDANLDSGRGLWLMGDTGTGKTTLAMLVSKAALAAGRTVAIYSLPKLLARIRRTYDAEAGQDSYLALFELLTPVDLLHIDDPAPRSAPTGCWSSSTP